MFKTTIFLKIWQFIKSILWVSPKPEIYAQEFRRELLKRWTQ